MKTKLIGAAVLSILLLTTPSVFAGHGGGHGGGGFSGYSGAGYGHGNTGYSPGVTGYNRAYSYSGGMRGYTGGGLGRVYSGYGQRFYAPQHAYSNRVYSSYSGNRTVTSGQYVSRAQTAITRTNRVAQNTQLRGAYANRAVQRNARTGFVTTRDGKTHPGNWARNNPRNQTRFDRQTQDKLRDWQGHRSDWAEANQRNHDNHHGHDGHHHDHEWWHNHCGAIILVDWGWWGWWDGWWYPAWGYDPYYSYYAYDGPIYGYGGLAPDEVIANVQSQLQSLGYYYGSIDGILGPQTQQALTRFQRDHGLPVTGAIDPNTIGSLGLG